ncbi:meiotic nuclear division protein 1 [Tilletiaria anomala UBC 951]|uniref:Meiotic nuclear division protein 1 n=1 Tax=Tilletiaria anomala (strain ATCC 24038 / CBS 436.72 / UBC 951) TaxID=1037660 RepID=A0A066WM78_TILAU|nr:meiotic nuclear division protein 1 [Tilletiaria anomala UBC 951]KDN52104.1 meiotic nuclear division protein 1 [Tilletiaria anomala UBC 951]
MVVKRMSAEEKMDEMFDLMIQSNEFFTLKELEKLGPKKGINAQNVKEVVDALVDEDRICREKIGSANYYWVFASQAAVVARNLSERIDTELSATRVKLQMAEKSLQTALAQGRDPTAMRQQMLASLAEARRRNRALQDQLKLYGDHSDPAALQARVQRIENAKKMAVGHTENLAAVISYARTKFQTDASQLRAQVDLKEDFEELEDTPVLIPIPVKTPDAVAKI